MTKVHKMTAGFVDPSSSKSPSSGTTSAKAPSSAGTGSTKGPSSSTKAPSGTKEYMYLK